MKCDWIVRQGFGELLLFFAGWGMDRRLADGLAASVPASRGCDLLSCSDYRTGEIDSVTRNAFAAYDRITVVAWSFGVWTAVHTDLPMVSRAVALNGTLFPVDSRRGIAPEVFHATLEGYSDENRRRFSRRMCGSSDALDHFLSMEPQRSTASQKEELASFAGRLETISGAPGFRYDHVIIGGRDMIFSPACQFAAWKGYAQTVIADMPHYPFFHLDGFREVLECSQ
jgi:biotin synthesis protein BioG